MLTWKNATFCAGLALLFLGAYLRIAPDWNYGVSIMMAVCTYLTATKTVMILITLNWRKWYYAAFTTWFSVDGVYVIYWFIRDREVLLAMRDVNWPVSICLYLACGVIWLLDQPQIQTLTDAFKSLRHLRK